MNANRSISRQTLGTREDKIGHLQINWEYGIELAISWVHIMQIKKTVIFQGIQSYAGNES